MQNGSEWMGYASLKRSLVLDRGSEEKTTLFDPSIWEVCNVDGNLNSD